MVRAGVYSVEVPGTEDAERGWGPIHRSVDGQEPTLGLFDPESGETVMTSYENFMLARRKYASRPFLGTRTINPDGTAGKYAWATFEEVGKRVDNFGSGLVNLNLAPPSGQEEVLGRGMLGLYSKNRADWFIAEQGSFTQSIIPVPMYDTLGADSVAYVINQTGLKSVVCSAEVAKHLIESKKQCPSLEVVVLMDAATPQIKAESEAAGLKVITMAEVEANGAAQPRRHMAPNASDIFTFCYTSGTTGDPKGALLTHSAIVTTFGASRARSPFRMASTDVHLSYLPLPHVFERIFFLGMVHHGVSIGFYQGETLKILEDLQELRPTIFPSVPRLLNRIHDKLLAGVEEAGGVKKMLFDRAYAAKKEGLRAGKLTHPLWDRLVFSKIRQRVGLDRARVIVTGSAPIADHVLEFLRIVFACPVLEGYGLSETAAGATITYESDLIAGTVGAPFACCEIRLQDVPDMGYLRTDQVHGKGEAAIPCHGRGEVCIRGGNVFKGYYRMPDKTAEAIDAEGWFHTGDIGMWTPDGRLKIIDRKKNIFKLAQGEYVAPEKIENLNMQSKFVMQNFVYGDSLKTQLVAVVVVDPDQANAWAKEKGIQKPLAELCKDPTFKQTVLADLHAVASANKLAGFEVVKAVHLEANQWQPGSDVLTPTFKLQRKKAEDKYRAEIDAMYAELEQAPPSKM